MELGNKLAQWTRIWSRRGGFDVSLKITDETFFPRPRGHMKCIKLCISDQHDTTLEFYIKKRFALKSLKDICFGVLANRIKDGLTINTMELPRTLRTSLRTEYLNCWALKRFPRFNIHISPYQEAMRRKKERQLEEKKKPQKPDMTIHRVRLGRQ